MKIFGIVFIAIGILVSVSGFVNSATDIQLGIGIMGIALVGTGLILVYLSIVREELEIVYLWARKDKE